MTVYYDYTCSYSYKALHWFDRAREADPSFEVRWATFSLKEVNRPPDEPSTLDDPATTSLSVLALALAHAAREADFDRYHRAVFEAMHADLKRLSVEELLGFAAAAGVDVGAFDRDRGSWIARLAAEHRDAVAKWGMYGTPTLLLNDAAAFVRLREIPGAAQSVGLLDDLRSLSTRPAALVELYREEPPPAPRTQVEMGKP